MDVIGRGEGIGRTSLGCGLFLILGRRLADLSVSRGGRQTPEVPLPEWDRNAGGSVVNCLWLWSIDPACAGQLSVEPGQESAGGKPASAGPEVGRQWWAGPRHRP